MITLKDIHKDQTIWIVGKGPSLQYLKKEHFGEGPVLTLNQAILAVEKLELPNIIYSLQKDGGAGINREVLWPNCSFTEPCKYECGDMVRPQNAILLLHDRESKNCFPDYPKRYVFDWPSLGLPTNVFSLIFAVRIALYMGINKFKFISCDATAAGDFRTYIPGKEAVYIPGTYGDQWTPLAPHVLGFDHEWITPMGEDEYEGE